MTNLREYQENLWQRNAEMNWKGKQIHKHFWIMKDVLKIDDEKETC